MVDVVQANTRTVGGREAGAGHTVASEEGLPGGAGGSSVDAAGIVGVVVVKAEGTGTFDRVTIGAVLPLHPEDQDDGSKQVDYHSSMFKYMC